MHSRLTTRNILIKATLFIALLALCSCSSWSCYPQRLSAWSVNYLRDEWTCTFSRRLFLPPSIPSRNFSIEIIKTPSGQRSYINLLTFEIDNDMTVVNIKINETFHTYLAEVFAGGQRILLPFEAANEMICGLLANEQVCITVENRVFEINRDGFLSSYQQFCSPPFLQYSEIYQLFHPH